MDGQKFDRIAKTLAAGTSRRRVLKGLAVGALGAAFGLRRGAESAAASCRAIGGPCQTTGDCCSGQHLVCTQVGTTGAHRCECDLSAGFQECNGACVNAACPGGQTFNSSTCACGCPSGQALCGGRCVSTACAGDLTFNSSTCTCTCPAGQTECPAGSGTCVANCTNGRVLNTSTCACECPSGTTACGGTCVQDCANGTTLDTSTCTCRCVSSTGEAGVFCNGACHFNSECTGNKTINVSCCNRGFNPCQNPGQVNTCHR
jgi:CXCXC repeat